VKTLYLSDLDGTLLRSDERISSYTVDVINRLVRSGGNFSYATARSIATASIVTAGLNTEFPVIAFNGVFIINNATNEKLRSNYFAMDESVYVSCELSKRGIYPIVFAYIDNRERFSFIDSHVTNEMRFFLDSRTDDIRRREVLNTNELYIGDMFYFACMDTEVSLAPIYEIFKSDKRYHCIYQKDFYSGAQWCEILPAKATKANAALQLKELLGCEKIVSFGDGKNDLSLFEISDECYAVSNAVPELKTIATAVIGSNEEDGVAIWIEENVL
jgi:Cof subfamily protein (haloacid dehalogenase superfamily)